MIIRTGYNVTPRPLHLDEIWATYCESVSKDETDRIRSWTSREGTDYCIDMTPKEQFMLMVGVIKNFKKVTENTLAYIF